VARKKKHPEHVNHERWLISYADFITLLFAFFVVMFAVSQVDSKKLGRFTEAFSKAVGNEVYPDRGKGILPAEDIIDEVAKTPDMLPPELEKVRAALVDLAKRSEALQGLQVLRRRNELVLRLSDSIFFDVGEDRVKPPALLIIRALGPELAKRDIDIRVEGHTDDRPISTVRFRSNWELSTARATSVLMAVGLEGVPMSHLSASGYGEFRPIAPNTTEEGRKQNRRVDLVVAVSTPLDNPEESAPESSETQ
jgi:chemotaxis protein MotB